MLVGDISERMFRALCIQLIRSGKLDGDDLIEASDELDAEGDADAAHALRCVIVEAMATPHSQREATERRSRMRSIDGGKAEE